MGSVSTIYNGVRQKLAGRALMDVAFSSTSTNGVQNKVIKAKFDEVESNKANKSSFVPTQIGSALAPTIKAYTSGEETNIAFNNASLAPNDNLGQYDNKFKPKTGLYFLFFDSITSTIKLCFLNTNGIVSFVGLDGQPYNSSVSMNGSVSFIHA